MTVNQKLVQAIYKGWHTYQEAVIKAIEPLGSEQLSLRSAPDLRSVGEITTHVIGARARWFYMLMGEGGDEFKEFGGWDRAGTETRSAQELVGGLEATWSGMHGAIGRWSPEDWEATWPGENGDEPEVITRQWVIWHLIEHDVHHGGEISITLGAHEVPALDL